MVDCVIGGIIKCNSLGTNMVGFRIGFRDAEVAQRYKDRFFRILQGDRLSVDVSDGYYDFKKEEVGCLSGRYRD